MDNEEEGSRAHGCHLCVRRYSQTKLEMPIISKKPDLAAFRHTQLYKEIKGLSGYLPTCHKPNEKWSLAKSIMKRENGLASKRGEFTLGQSRRISNIFRPNHKKERLMSADTKMYISKFNKDGSRLITASRDAAIRVFDSSKGIYHRIHRIQARATGLGILDLDFSPCGNFFAYCTLSAYFFISPVMGSRENFQWLRLPSKAYMPGIFSLRFSPCGKDVIAGCNDSCVHIYERETNHVIPIKTQDFTVDINAVSYISETNSNVFVTGCDNGLIRLWDKRCVDESKEIGTPVSTFAGHADGITYIDPRNDGFYILSNSKDQSIKIWDLRRPTNRRNIPSLFFPRLAWDYRHNNVPYEYYNPRKKIEGDVSVMTFRGHRVTNTLIRAKFSPIEQTGNRYIYSGCGTGRIIIYDVLTGTIKEAISGHKDVVRDLSWHPRRAEIVSGSWDSHVNLYTYRREILIRNDAKSTHDVSVRRSRRLATKHLESDEEDAGDTDYPGHTW